MKILIDLTCMSSSMSGVRRYASCISEEMLKMDKENEYILLFHNDIYPSFLPYIDEKRITSRIINCNNNVLLKLFKLQIELYKIKADMYLFLYSKNPLFFYKKNIINTIHDLSCWDCPKTMYFFQMLHSRFLNIQAKYTSSKLITVSNFTKERIIKLLKYPKENIIVTYEGVSNTLKDNNISFNEIKNKYNLPDNYIMNLSTLEPRKNLQLLIKAFNEVSSKVNYDLVLIGKKGWKIEKVLNSINKNSRIHLTGFIKDEEAVQIYKHAKCFVFTSLYEGFGLPPLEALSLGTSVLSSDSGSLPEILRNQARYFHNNDLESLKNELLYLDNNIPTMPKTLDEFQLQNYNFNTAAKKVLAILNSTLQ